MQYLKDRWLKIIFIAFPLLLIMVIFLYSSIHNEKPKGDNLQPNISLRDKPEGHYDNFRVNKISIVTKEENRILFSLSADMIIHRKRISKLFVYQNLKEICMSGVMIDIYPYNMHSINKHKNIAIPIDDIGSSFTSLGKPSTPIEEYLAGNADTDLDLLTRLLLEDLSINIHLPDNKKIVLAARSARINVDLENIVLEGPVKVITSDGKELYASEAVWSKKFNGIYLPDGYALQNEQHKGKAFFAINTKGEFSRIWKCPNIEYVDPLEEREKAFYANLSKKMPASVRFMFGMGIPRK
jgi:hypothetical protein